MSIKKLAKEYLTFGKRDRIGIIALFLLILIIYLLPRLTAGRQDNSSIKEVSIPGLAPDTVRTENLHSKSKETKHRFQTGDNRKPGNPVTDPVLFNFDPNTLPKTGWQKLGLDEKTIRTIENYRNKGGRFYKAGDLQRIWGLPDGFYERVKNNIKIEYTGNEEYPRWEKPVRTTDRKPLLLEINQSDSAMFEMLPGIGPRLAARIVSFRQKLGGFYEVEQIGETYGLPDTTFQKIKSSLFIDGTAVTKLSVNKASREELRAHPYLKWALANAIIEYRTQHGDYKSLDELKKITLIDAKLFNRLVHYLTL